MLNDRLQQWLTETGTSRADFAEKVHVSKRTVDNWLGKKHRPIPAAKRAIVEKIIAPKNAPGCIAVNFSFSEEKWEALTGHLPEGVDKVEYITNLLNSIIAAAKIPDPPEQP